MTRDDEHRAIGLLETLGGTLGELRAESRLMRADVAVIRQAQEEHGKRIASLPCERHARRISEALRGLRAEEVTGRVELAKGDARRDMMRSIGRIALGLFAVLGVMWPILWALTH